MASLCPECAHWLYGYPNCAHDFIVGPGKRYCRRCGWDCSRSDHVRELIAGTDSDWLQVVAPCPLSELEQRFVAWCSEHGLKPDEIAPENIKQEVGRWSAGGSFGACSVRKSALNKLG